MVLSCDESGGGKYGNTEGYCGTEELRCIWIRAGI